MSDVPSTPAAPTSGGASSTPVKSTGAASVPKTQSTPTKTPAAAAPVAPNPKPNGERKLSDQVQKPSTPAAETPAQKEVRKELERRKYQFKVDGEEWEEELDDNEVRVRLQKSLGADRRMQEAAELRKKFNDALAYGKDNIPEALKTLFGVDADEWVESRLEHRYKDAMMSPEEKERAALQKELEQYKARENQTKQQAEAAARQKFESEVWEKTEGEFIGALERLGYEPEVGKSLLPMMADIADAALNVGMELDSELLAHETNKRLRAVNRHRLTGLKGDNLLAELGDDVVKEVLRAKLAAAKMSANAPADPVAAAPREKKPSVTDEREKPQKPTMTSTKFRRKHLFGL